MDNADLTLANLAPTFGDAVLDPRALIKSVIVTLLLWGFAFAARHLVVTFLRRRGLAPQELRRLMATSRNVMVLVLVTATAMFWLDELRTFAVSLVAVAAAIVIATKELIMGAGGTFLRTSARVFDIGDRVEINGIRGDVIDTTLFTTTILEIGPGKVGFQQTGRSITIPNAVLLTAAVVNEAAADAWVVHTFEVPTDISDWAASEATLLEACVEEHRQIITEAKTWFERRLIERGIEMPALEPVVLVRVDDPRRATLLASVPALSRRRGSVEQAILRRYLTKRAASESTTSLATSAVLPCLKTLASATNPKADVSSKLVPGVDP